MYNDDYLVLCAVNDLLYHAQRPCAETAAALDKIQERVAALRVVREEAAEPAVPAVFAEAGGRTCRCGVGADVHKRAVVMPVVRIPIKARKLRGREVRGGYVTNRIRG